MSNIKEIIKTQAASVKASGNNEKVASLLLQAAQLLQGGTKDGYAAFTAHVNKKKEAAKTGRNKFNAALAAFEGAQVGANKAHQILTSKQWQKTNGAQNASATYNNAGKPGHEIKLQENTFTHTKDGRPVKEKTPLAKLPDYLNTI